MSIQYRFVTLLTAGSILGGCAIADGSQPTEGSSTEALEVEPGGGKGGPIVDDASRARAEADLNEALAHQTHTAQRPRQGAPKTACETAIDHCSATIATCNSCLNASWWNTCNWECGVARGACDTAAMVCDL